MSEEATATTEEVVETTATESASATEKAFVDTFRESIQDEDVKSAKFWERLNGKGADELGQYIKELNSFNGKKGDIPKADAPDADWDAFHQKLGRPESIDGYDFDLSHEFKELVGEGQSAFYEQAMDWFKDAAFKSGTPTEKAEQMFNGYLDMITKQSDEVAKVRAEREQEAEIALKNEWGDNRDGIELGIKAMLKDKGGLDENDIAEFENLGFLKEPKLAIALARISAKFESDPELGEFMAETAMGLDDQKLDVETQMQREMKEFGHLRPETKNKWMKLTARINQ